MIEYEAFEKMIDTWSSNYLMFTHHPSRKNMPFREEDLLLCDDEEARFHKRSGGLIQNIPRWALDVSRCFSYGLHHNKAPSFTTIWDHVLGTCFKHLKQIQVAFPNFALTMPMPIIKWVIKHLLTHHTSSVTAIMHISISMFLVFLKSQRNTWATGKKKTTRIWSKNPSKTPKLWKHPRPKQSTGGNFPISVLGWVASGH